MKQLRILTGKHAGAHVDLISTRWVISAEDEADIQLLDWTSEPWRSLTEEVKQSTGTKGRELFHPLRLALTGRESGPEMAGLVAAMGRERAVRRLEAAARR